MRSLLGRFHRPFARSADEQLLLMNNLGDGSTLSLDFTTMGNTLDPRLTFTRGSNATFINSSGLVEIAGANMFRNSVLVGGGGLNTPPTSWNNGVAGATYTVANNEVKIETNAGGTARAYMFANYFGSSASGLRYTIQFVVTARTGSAYRLDELVGLPSNPPVSGTEQWSVNGTSRSSSYTGWGSGDTITYSAVTTGGSSFFPSIGCGIFNALGSTTSVTITRPQMNLGSTASAYYANSSTSAGYHDVPRFDYDPTTIGSPRGLLIEGAANNLSLDSENFSAWSTGNTSLSSESGDTNPDGITVPTRVSDNSTNGEHFRSRSPSLTTATTYTKSVWFKNPATNGRRYGGVQLFAGGGTDVGGVVAVWDFDTGQPVPSLTFGYGGKPTPSVSCVPYKSGWYRVSISMTVTGTLTTFNHRIVLSNGTATSYANGGTALGLLVWGAQLETGSGASSYIPTGASQGSRAADVCTIPTSSFITGPLYPHTLFAECIPANPSAAFLDIMRLFDRTAGGTFSYGTELYYYGSSTMTVQRKINASTNTDRLLASGLAYNSRHKLAVAVDSSAFLGSYDGLTGSGTTTAPSALASQVTHMGIGCSGDASAGSVMFGTIRQIKFFPFAMAQSQLNALTTL